MGDKGIAPLAVVAVVVAVVIAAGIGYFLFIEGQPAPGGPSENQPGGEAEEAGVSIYPGATEFSIPNEMKSGLGISAGVTCKGYTTSAAPEDVMDWYKNQMGDWTLMSEESFSPPDRPGVTVYMQHYRKGDNGAFMFATSDPQMGGATILGIVTGPWSLIQGCGGEGPGEGGPPVGDGEEIEFAFPIDLDKVHYEGGGISPFGMHDGDHPEGLDHIWVYCTSADTPAKAPADGDVFQISGGPGEWMVIIQHSERFQSEFYLLDSILVQEGDHVTKGQTIGYPISVETWVPTYFFDYWLVDMSRNDGVWAMPDVQMGSRVSPYEYLESSVKEAIENAYRENMYNVYKNQRIKVGVFNPYEPNLTNEIFLHKGNEGTPVGVWISLERKWEKDGVPDMVTILNVNNEFYSGYRFIFYDGWIGGESKSGSCEINNETGEITFHADFPEPQVTTYYGIFEVTEDDRASLRLEYREGSRPSSFSDAVLNFVVRSQRMPRSEVAEQFPDLPYHP